MNDDLRLASLLNELVVEDEALDPPETLEERTLAAWDAWQQTPAAQVPSRVWQRWLTPTAAAAAAALAVATAAGYFVLRDDRSTPRDPGVPVRAADTRAPSAPAADAGTSESGAAGAPRPIQIDRPAVDPEPTADRAETWAFLRLMPGPDGDLSGSFQIARVRVPRRVLADLGVLGLPGDGRDSDAAIDADVMFGDDGLARAIRVVSTSRRVP